MRNALMDQTVKFQSRNRGSYRFKGSETISNQAWVAGFQSRNRGSYRFKHNAPYICSVLEVGVSIS